MWTLGLAFAFFLHSAQVRRLTSFNDFRDVTNMLGMVKQTLNFNNSKFKQNIV